MDKTTESSRGVKATPMRSAFDGPIQAECVKAIEQKLESGRPNKTQEYGILELADPSDGLTQHIKLAGPFNVGQRYFIRIATE